MDESSAPDQLSYVLIWISRTMFYLLVWLSLAWRLAFQQTISTNACPINLVKKIMIHFHQGGLSLYIYIYIGLRWTILIYPRLALKFIFLLSLKCWDSASIPLCSPILINTVNYLRVSLRQGLTRCIVQTGFEIMAIWWTFLSQLSEFWDARQEPGMVGWHCQLDQI